MNGPDQIPDRSGSPWPPPGHSSQDDDAEGLTDVDALFNGRPARGARTTERGITALLVQVLPWIAVAGASVFLLFHAPTGTMLERAVALITLAAVIAVVAQSRGMGAARAVAATAAAATVATFTPLGTPVLMAVLAAILLGVTP